MMTKTSVRGLVGEELSNYLLKLEREWQQSQQRFYDDEKLVFYGAGVNVDFEEAQAYSERELLNHLELVFED